jgi:riboflavin kinase/FMN adenylyltransferase
MRVIRDLSQADLPQDAILTIGAFDGVHLGHQQLVKQLCATARREGSLAVLVTFHPDPAAFLKPESERFCLTSPQEKVALLGELGLDLLATLPFDRELRRTPALDFVQQLRRHLRMKALWVGPDFALGYNRQGDVAALRGWGQELGFSVRVVEPVVRGGAVISSTRIRRLLVRGQVVEATELLGRYPHIAGKVVAQAGRGRSLGFPTANLLTSSQWVILANGVYAVYVWWAGRRWPGVANIGVRPTFAENERVVEVHLLDFRDDLYGRELAVEFVERLRPERRFADAAELVGQMEADITLCRRLLAARDNTGMPTSHLLAALRSR